VRLRKAVALTASFLLPVLVPSLVTTSGALAAPAPLTGLFALTPGSCAGGVATGSYFRMILASGTPSGPFLSNSDSTCSSDESYTLLSPGGDGGLQLGRLQPQPTPPFDGNGNARATRVIDPVRFFGVDFSAATNAVDPQTGAKVTAPTVTVSGSTVSADLRALGVAWNNQHFNQGAPKPDGSIPGNTRRATGRYDNGTGELTLQWTSQIQGGPFNGFTGLWHLTGTVTPAPTGSSPTAPAAAAATHAAPTAGTTAPSLSSAAPVASATGSAPAASAGPTSAVAVPSAAASADGRSPTTAPVDRTDATLSGAAGDEDGLPVPLVLVGLVAALAAGTLVLRARRRA
jgi:hypothetical protein